MKCDSKDCMYYVYDECIRTDITIKNGMCPYYKVKELTIADVFAYPVVHAWNIQYQSGESLNDHGHILDVCAKHYKDNYILITPSLYITLPKAIDKKLPEYIDMVLYLRFMDNHIYGLYMEDFILTYLENSSYTINKLDCHGHYVHVKGQLKGD